MSSIKKTDHYYLIDGSGYIFRAYYALPPLSRKSDGLPTGAVSGFCSMLFKLLEDSRSDDSIHKPTHFAVIFDSARKNFRNDIYSEYKANRAEAPDDLVPQFEYIRKSVLAFNLPSIELINYEADDLIATYTEQILNMGAKVTIVSSDKDLMQLYKKNVRIYDPMKNKFIDEKDAVSVLLKPGQLSIHHPMTIHGSGPNLSKERRIGFAIQSYIGDNVDQVLGKTYVQLARGNDRYKFHNNINRPKKFMQNENLIAYGVIRLQDPAYELSLIHISEPTGR